MTWQHIIINTVLLVEGVAEVGMYGWMYFASRQAATKGGQTIIGEGMKRVSVAAEQNPGSVILNSMPEFTGTAEEVQAR